MLLAACCMHLQGFTCCACAHTAPRLPFAPQLPQPSLLLTTTPQAKDLAALLQTHFGVSACACGCTCMRGSCSWARPPHACSHAT